MFLDELMNKSHFVYFVLLGTIGYGRDKGGRKRQSFIRIARVKRIITRGCMKITRDTGVLYWYRGTGTKSFGTIIEIRVSEECSEQWAWFDRRSSANKDTGMQTRGIIIDGLTITCVISISIIRGQAEAIVRSQFSRFARA